MAAKLLSDQFLAKETGDKARQGSCLCGAVKYQLIGAPSSAVICHCISCQKSCGSTFQANNVYTNSQLEVKAASSEAVKTYQDKSPDTGGVVYRSFCRECGSRLWNRNPLYTNAVIMMTGTLDDAVALGSWKPEKEYYCKRRGPWLPGFGTEEGNRFDGMA